MVKRLGLSVAVAGILTAVVLAVVPMSYTARTGPAKGEPGLPEPIEVNCGITFAPKNPPPPPGNNDECDQAHIVRGLQVIGVASASLLAGGFMFVALGRRSRGEPAPSV
jgi:hypothetical protein